MIAILFSVAPLISRFTREKNVVWKVFAWLSICVLYLFLVALLMQAVPVAWKSIQSVADAIKAADGDVTTATHSPSETTLILPVVFLISEFLSEAIVFFAALLLDSFVAFGQYAKDAADHSKTAATQAQGANAAMSALAIGHVHEFLTPLPFFSKLSRGIARDLLSAVASEEFPARLRAHLALCRMRPSYDSFGSKHIFKFFRAKSDFYPDVLPSDHETLERKMRKQQIDDFEWVLETIKSSWRVIAYRDLSALFDEKNAYMKLVYKKSEDPDIDVKRVVVFPRHEFLRDVVPKLDEFLQSEGKIHLGQLPPLFASAMKSLLKFDTTDQVHFVSHDTPVEVEQLAKAISVEPTLLRDFLRDIAHLVWISKMYAKMSERKAKCVIIHSAGVGHVKNKITDADDAKPLLDNRESLGEILLGPGFESSVTGMIQNAPGVDEGAALLDEQVLVRVDYPTDFDYIQYELETNADGKKRCKQFARAVDEIVEGRTTGKTYNSDQVQHFLKELLSLRIGDFGELETIIYANEFLEWLDEK